ncbi:hypothetical protein N9M26_01145 [Alphaproteobacteria bacterium]|nr:hypothetical protein [Alphaproteobacteria bacterium]
MAIKNYSTTASSNTAVNGSSLAEGMSPSAVNNSMREIVKDIRDGFNDKEWFILGDGDQGTIFTRASASSITVASDISSSHHVGRRVKVVGSNTGTIYGKIATSSYSSPNTTITFTFDSGSISSSDTTVDVYVGSTFSNPATPVVDEDDMSSDSAILPPSQQSTKAFVTSGTVTLSNKSIDLSTNTLTGTTAEFNTALSDNDFATLAGTETFTNKTLTSPVLNTAISGTAFKDEDDMVSDSATAVASQQSIKAYVDAQLTAQDLDLTDGTSTIAIDLDSETLGVLGGTGIDSTASGNNVTLAIDSTVATLTGTQTLTNKTISGSSNTLSNIGNSSLTNSTVSYGGVSLALGASDATPAFDLQDATSYPASALTGTISNAQLAGTIDATKIHDGTISNTEFGYLNGVTSAIQTQIDSKLTASNNLSDITTASTARTNLGLGTMATQSASSVAITGGSVTGMGSPSAGSDVATKTYVDNLVAGLKTRIITRVATTANVDLTADLQNGDTIDGITLVTGDKVLVKNQTSASENGIYDVVASGTATRNTDYDTIAELAGQIVVVQEGTTNGDKIYLCTTDTDATLGSSDITFTIIEPANTGTVTSVAVADSGSSEFTITGSPVTSSGTISLAVNSINATKIGSGTVDNTEFGYLNGATSNIQTQIDAKAGAGFAVAMAIAL